MTDLRELLCLGGPLDGQWSAVRTDQVAISVLNPTPADAGPLDPVTWSQVVYRVMKVHAGPDAMVHAGYAGHHVLLVQPCDPAEAGRLLNRDARPVVDGGRTAVRFR